MLHEEYTKVQAMSVEELKAEIDNTVEQYKAATVKAEKVRLAGRYSVLTNEYNQKAREPYTHTADTKIKTPKAQKQVTNDETKAIEQPVVVEQPQEPQAAEVPATTEEVVVPSEAPKNELRKPKSLTVAECEDIWNRVKAGEKRSAIATEYNVHPSTIADVMGGRTINSKHLKTENQ